MLPFLQALKANKITIALGSASKNARTILERVGITSFFDVIVDGNLVTKAKPDPEVFTLGAQLAGVPRSPPLSSRTPKRASKPHSGRV